MIADIFRKKVEQESKVQREVDEASTLGLASLRIIAKNTLTLKRLSRDLRSLNKAFSNYVKLHNIEPATGEKLSDLKKSLSSHDDIKTARIKVTRERQKEKPRTFMASILDKVLKLIFAAVAGTLLAIGYVVYKLVEIIKPYVFSFINNVIKTISSLGNAITNFYEETDFANLMLSSFKKYLGFISFGLINEKDVDAVLSQTGSFYKILIENIGVFLKDAIDWLAPKLRSIGRYIGKDLLGVDIDKLAEKRAIKEVLAAEAKRLQDEYRGLENKNKELTKKKSELTDQLRIKQNEIKIAQLEEEKKKVEEKTQKVEGFFNRIFKKEQKKKEEVKSTPEIIAKREEVKPDVTPKVDISKVKPSDGTAAPIQEPTKPTTAEKKKEESQDGSGDVGMKYSEGSNVIKIISKYGMRQLPDEKQPRLHGGIDYAAALATPITFKGTEAKVAVAQFVNGYGRVIDLSVDKEVLRFAHLSKMLVKPGDVIRKGDTIGLVGGSGGQGKVNDNAFGPHLHFEHRSKSSWGKINNKDTYDPVKSGAVSLISFGDKIAATDYSLSEKYANYKGEYGEGLNAESSKIALAYREQSKPQNPTYVNARTTNNNLAQRDTNLIAAKV